MVLFLWSFSFGPHLVGFCGRWSAGPIDGRGLFLARTVGRSRRSCGRGWGQADDFAYWYAKASSGGPWWPLLGRHMGKGSAGTPVGWRSPSFRAEPAVGIYFVRAFSVLPGQKQPSPCEQRPGQTTAKKRERERPKSRRQEPNPEERKQKKGGDERRRLRRWRRRFGSVCCRTLRPRARLLPCRSRGTGSGQSDDANGRKRRAERPKRS